MLYAVKFIFVNKDFINLEELAYKSLLAVKEFIVTLLKDLEFIIDTHEYIFNLNKLVHEKNEYNEENNSFDRIDFDRRVFPQLVGANKN